jgi:phosphoribosyl-AMP cyclohydrolase / phosphoribosyl-ATP pyrophosphohydrolase
MMTRPATDPSARAVSLATLPQLDFDKGGGLLPAVIQDAADGAVLMLGYMNADAVRATLTRGRVVFYSRSKQRLWEKGETSGHFLELIAMHVDCDADTLLVTARAHGPVCHLGTRTCFGEAPLTATPPATATPPPLETQPLAFLAQLEQVVAQRLADRPQGSYTARLLAEGPLRVAQKVGEEGLELALAAAAQSDDRVLGEAADLLYHMLVLLQSRQLSLAGVVAELQARHGQPA